MGRRNLGQRILSECDRLAPHGMDSMRGGSHVSGKREAPITKVTIVAIGVTAGNERIAARYSEDGALKSV